MNPSELFFAMAFTGVAAWAAADGVWIYVLICGAYAIVTGRRVFNEDFT